MSALSALLTAMLTSVLALPALAGAEETARLIDDEGTVHYTNAPNDPRYRRLGGAGEPTAPTGPAAVASAPLAAPKTTAARFAVEIAQAARRYGVPERLVEAVIRAESGFKPSAVSRKGARGLMQLMPGTAAVLGVRNSFDPHENIDGGVRHLKGLMDRYANDLRLALAAYNAGENAVDLHGDVPPYPETQQYVARILTEYGAAPAVPVVDVPLSAYYRYEDGDDTITYTNIPRQ